MQDDRLEFISFAYEETHSHGKRDLEKGKNKGGKKLSDIRKEYEEMAIHKALNDIEDWEDGVEDVTEKMRQLDHDDKESIARHEKSLKALKEGLQNAKDKIDTYNEVKAVLEETPDLFDWDAHGTNEQKAGRKGYKNGISKASTGINPKSFKIDIGDKYDKRQGLTSKGGWDFVKDKKKDDVMRESKLDSEFMKGKTVISDSEMLNSKDPEIKEQMDTIFDIWNNVFDDDMRSGIDILNIRNGHYLDLDFQKKGGVAVGSFGERELFDVETGDPDIAKDDKLVLGLSSFSILLTENDSKNEIMAKMIHEVNHKLFHDMEKERPEKVKAFVDKVFEIGKDGAISNYAMSFWDKYESQEKAIAAKEKYFKDRTDGEYSQKAKDDDQKNLEKLKTLIANEFHSEFTSGLAVPFGETDGYWDLRPNAIKKANELIQELYS